MREVAQESRLQAIDPGTTLGMLTLRVADAARSARFYQEALGFQDTGQVRGMPSLGAAGVPILLLKETHGAVPGRRSPVFTILPSWFPRGPPSGARFDAWTKPGSRSARPITW